MNKPESTRLGGNLLQWFDSTRRTLPWRQHRTVYTTWVSEVMLQQTRVDQVTPYYDRFLHRFPDLDALATADVDDVMKEWEGLGYYARARNLHRAAQVVAERGFPSDRASWLDLPGIGPYTSAAVASIIHGEAVVAVDGNVARVISRLFLIEEMRGTVAFDTAVEGRAREILTVDRPGDFNEALMDLGATVCTPKSPDCDQCPLQEDCLGYRRADVLQYPRRRARKPVPTYTEFVAFVTDANQNVLVRKRPIDGFLGGLWELPGSRYEPTYSDEDELAELVRTYLESACGVSTDVDRMFGTVEHAYSHFRVRIIGFECHGHSTESSNMRDLDWMTRTELDAVAISKAHRKVLDLVRNVPNDP